MAKDNKKNRIRFEDMQYVINNLPKKDMEKVDAMEVELIVLLAMMEREIENGGSFSYKYDDYSECPQMTLGYYIKGHVNSGYCVAARGENVFHCLKILAYKLHEVAKGDLSSLTETAKSKQRYG